MLKARDSALRGVRKKPLRCQVSTLALMDNLERVSVRIKHIRGVVSRIVSTRARGEILSLAPAEVAAL